MTRISLQCRECKKEYDSTFKYICDECFGPLDVKYNFPSLTKDTFTNREHTYWRYFELLPILDKANIVSIDAGMTPLIKAKKLGKELGLDNLYIKNDKRGVKIGGIEEFFIDKIEGGIGQKVKYDEGSY